jgi:hypothetical protein
MYMTTRTTCAFLICLWTTVAQVASAQSVSWTHQFGTPSDDFAFGVAVDPLGVYSAGYTGNLEAGTLACQTNTGNSNSFVRQYNPLDNTETVRASGNFEVARSVAVYAGNVYSAGLNQGTGTAVVRKADPDGWTKLFVEKSQAYGVAVNSTGIYAVGFIIVGGSVTVAGDVQAFVRKYDFNGYIQWTQIFGTSAEDYAIGVALDGNSLYVTGSTRGTLGLSNSGGRDIFVRKYDISEPAPMEVWTKQFGTAANDTAFGAASDTTGVYVAGCYGGTGAGDFCASDADAFVGKYNSGGTSDWFSQFGAPTAATFDVALGVAVNGSGVYVSGYTDGQLSAQGPIGNSDAYVRNYTHSGVLQWTNQFGTPAADLAWGVTADASGAVVAGCTAGALPGQSSAGGSDAFIAGNPLTSISIAIDIRPGATPNNINLGSGGVVPVAILSSATFDATTVDPMTVSLNGATVKLKGNGSYQTIQQDVNGDGRTDLIVHVNTSALELSAADVVATLTGLTVAGQPFHGKDLVRIVP